MGPHKSSSNTIVTTENKFRYGLFLELLWFAISISTGYVIYCSISWVERFQMLLWLELGCWSRLGQPIDIWNGIDPNPKNPCSE
jgi:hypothetical protein